MIGEEVGTIDRSPRGRAAVIMRVVPVSNRIVAGVLQSPFHRLLSGSICLVRYRGRRSGREITTPTQYARFEDEVIILVGRAEEKTWWRNFRDERDLELLLRRRWQPMTGLAVVGADRPEAAAPLLDAYLDRFPKAARSLGDARADRVGGSVLVRCRPPVTSSRQER